MPREISVPVANYNNKSAKIDDTSNGNMPYDRQKYAVQIAHEAFANRSGRFDRAEYIKDKFDSKYAGRWACFIYAPGEGSSCLTYKDNCYILFQLQGVSCDDRIQIAKVSRENR